MPVVVFASAKGGCGKTTCAVILGSELVQRGASVTIIDADPNRNVADWASPQSTGTSPETRKLQSKSQ